LLNSAVTIGLMGEYLAAAAIISIGTHKVSLCQQTAVDLVAFDADSYLSVQVKTSTLHQRLHRQPSYQFQLAHGSKVKRKHSARDFDIYALVAGDPSHRRCLFLPTAKLCLQSTKRLSPSRFTAEAEVESWHRAVDYVLEMRK
jgi:hypothetical protein